MPILYRKRAVGTLHAGPGAYVLCDLDQSPIYVGQSTDGIRTRVARHLTSARSDIIANRMVDIWEVAYVWAYPATDDVDDLEAFLFHHFNEEGDVTLFNGAELPRPRIRREQAPEPIVTQVLPDEEIRWRRKLSNRAPRQAQHFAALLDVFLSVKPEEHIARALKAHFIRLQLYHSLLQRPFVVPDLFAEEGETYGY